MDKHDPYLYPRGRSKLEPLAVILTAVIMAVANLEIIIESIQSMAENKVNPIVDWSTIGMMLAVIAVKAILMVICWRQGTVSARVLMMDHRNDCESNAMAIACAFIGSRYWKWADPIGAILICSYIIIQWFITGREQIPLLSGKRASPEYINRIIRLCIDHDPRIKQLETVYVYHYGSKFLTEVHIVFDEQTPFKLTHDISEELQMKLEHLPFVERAFIHCDYLANARMCGCGQKH